MIMVGLARPLSLMESEGSERKLLVMMSRSYSTGVFHPVYPDGDKWLRPVSRSVCCCPVMEKMIEYCLRRIEIYFLFNETDLYEYHNGI